MTDLYLWLICIYDWFHQTISWTDDLLTIEPLGTNLSEILIKLPWLSFKKMTLKLSSAKMASILSRPSVLTCKYIQQRAVRVHISRGSRRQVSRRVTRRKIGTSIARLINLIIRTGKVVDGRPGRKIWRRGQFTKNMMTSQTTEHMT